jgi:hypothetical protein
MASGTMETFTTRTMPTDIPGDTTLVATPGITQNCRPTCICGTSSSGRAMLQYTDSLKPRSVMEQTLTRTILDP